MKKSLFCLFLYFIFSGVATAQSPFYTKVNNVDELQQMLSPGSDALPMVSAHRGGPYSGFPENCLATFENVLTYTPAIFECDVRMTKDSVLMMMHDETLDRTTTGSGKVSDHTWKEVSQLELIDEQELETGYRIPTFDKVLAWTKGKAILTVDVKHDVPFDMIVDAIERQHVEAYAVVITYNLEDAKTIHQLNPNLMLSVTIRNEEELTRARQSGIPLDMMVAFVGITEPAASLYKQLHREGIACILGTMGNLDQQAKARGMKRFKKLVKNGADILSTDIPVEAAAAIQEDR